MRDDLLRSVITHGDNAAAAGHERRGAPGQGDQRVGADVQGDAVGLAAGVDKFAFQRLARSESDRVEKQMKFAEFPGGLRKNGSDFLVLGDIAGQNQSVGAEGGGEFLDIGLEPFALVGESEGGAGLMPGLGNGPGDGTFVGHAEHQSDFSVK